MGQKVNPNGFRVGVIRDWNTRWYASKKDFADYLVEDHEIREFVKKKYYSASISRIEIERAAGKITVSIYTCDIRDICWCRHILDNSVKHLLNTLILVC